MKLTLFTSAFCEPCAQTSRLVARVRELVPALEATERDIVREADEAERAGIRSTPTIIVRDTADAEVFRAEGVPTLNQLLVAVAKAL